MILADDSNPGYRADTLKIEAEDCLEVAAPFVIVPANDASGNRALMVPDGTAKGEGHAIYTVVIPQGGNYELFARVLWQDGCGNSVRFDVGASSCVLADEVFGEWHLLRGQRRFDLQAGVTTVVVNNLEDGIRIDYWGLRAVDER